VIRLQAAILGAIVALVSAAAQANDGAPPYTFEGSGPGPVLELNDQGSPTFQAVPEPVHPAAVPPAPNAPAAPAAVPAPAKAPVPVAAPAPAPAPTVTAPASVAAPTPAPVIRPPIISPSLAQPPQQESARPAPPIVAPVTSGSLQWETPPQGRSPFAEPEPEREPEREAEPVPMFEPKPEAPKACTREDFERGLCIVR
jgi:hypothetical protein